jgi:hypothetical protein
VRYHDRFADRIEIMMKLRFVNGYRLLLAVSLLMVGSVSAVRGGVGESAVITLSFPFGARSAGMGEVGTALADDVSALFFNPAGLGVQNRDWRGGAAAWSFEYLLPAFKLSELWHTAVSGYVSLPGSLGGLGVYCNYINMGMNTIVDELGREELTTHSWEAVWALGWGFSLEEFGDRTRFFGITVKPFVSALAPGLGEHGEGVAQSFAVDAGYLRVFDCGIRYAFTFANMGPAVFYIDRNNIDPIPFTAATAFAWKRRVVRHKAEVFRFATEFRLDKELVVNRFDGRDPDPFYKAMFTDWFDEPMGRELQEINVHAGVEFCLMNTVTYRQGILFDWIGERYEMHYGVGLHLFNHIKGDFAWIYSPEGYMKNIVSGMEFGKDGATGARHLQWHLTITIDALGGWNEKDMEWWMVR